jgi:ADP-ribose pyrophosphatase YjhB (NUDIX family)
MDTWSRSAKYLAKTVKKKTKLTRVSPHKEVSVMAWIEVEGRGVLLVRQVAGQQFWTLPGGKVRLRESLHKALEREIREETNLDVKAEKWMSLMDRPERGALMVLFSVVIEKWRPWPKLPTREISEIRFASELPKNASPSAKYFWKLIHNSSPRVGAA